MPSRTPLAAVAVTSTTVSPIWATTAPSARPASLPVSNDRVFSEPVIAPETLVASAMGCPPLGATSAPVWRRGQFPVVDRPMIEIGRPATGS